MGKVGATDSGGISRYTLSQADKEARDLLVEWMEELNLKVRIDDVGNIYGRKEGSLPGKKPIVLGSHLDSIINGGKFDGILGIICGLEIIKTLEENGVVTKSPIEIVNFTNEEGVRFKPLMAGSGIISNDYDINDIYQEIDSEGKVFFEELNKIGYLGDINNRLKEAAAFIELHIEQGPLLDIEKIPIGIVENILGFTWLEVTVIGQAENSGPTPMRCRKDALSGAAKMITAIQKIPENMSEDAITTVGKIEAEPGSINTIPGKVTFTIDIRDKDFNKQIEGINRIKYTLEEIAKNENLVIEFKEIETMKPIAFSEELSCILKSTAKELGYQWRSITSGAGHIATFMNNFCHTCMIFVPSINGFSHSPKEFTDWKDIEKATNLLLNAVINVDNYPLEKDQFVAM